MAQPIPVKLIPIEILIPLKGLSAECSSSSFVASVEVPTQGERKANLRIIQTQTLPEGSFKGVVSLKGESRDGKKIPERRLEFIGTIASDVEAVPSAVQVSGRRLGETFEEAIALRSITGKQSRKNTRRGRWRRLIS